MICFQDVGNDGAIGTSRYTRESEFPRLDVSGSVVIDQVAALREVLTFRKALDRLVTSLKLADSLKLKQDHLH